MKLGNRGIASTQAATPLNLVRRYAASPICGTISLLSDCESRTSSECVWGWRRLILLYRAQGCRRRPRKQSDDGVAYPNCRQDLARRSVVV